jgi:hypothetical protein
MVANTTEKAAVQGTVLTFDSLWQKPVIPVFAGVTGWSAVEDCGFTRWYARPGQVVLGMWESEYERSDDEIAASGAPVLEVVLPLDRYTNLLLEAMATGGATLAVLEWLDGENGPLEWGAQEIRAEGLGAVIQLAMGQLP